MMNLDDTSLFAMLAQLKAEWPGSEWSWDGRMCCVRSSFTDALQDKARAVTLAALPTEYNSANIVTAIAPLTELIDRLGGLREGQFLFVREALAPVAFGLWWPWGGGTPTSLRVGLLDVDADGEPNRRLREIFNVTG